MARDRTPVFVGRDAELNRLVAVVDDLVAGRPGLLLLGGDAGVGKSCLLGELTVRARTAGVRVVLGGCLDFGEVGLPYAPVREALRDLADQLGVDVDRCGGDPVFPLHAWLTEAAGASNGWLDGAAATHSQGSYFDLVRSVLGRAAQIAPLLVLVEDLHWADASTRDLLAFLARNLRRSPVALVGTYRYEDMNSGHPLRHLIAELTRAGAERVELTGLDDADLRRMSDGIAGNRLPGPLVETVLRRSEGNPFYAEQLLAAALSGEAGLPASLREVLLVRVENLPASCQRVLEVMAVAGQRASHALLERVAVPAGLPEGEDLDQALERAVDAGLLVAVTPDAYRFKHALIREAVSAQLPPGRRRRMHRLLAQVLEDRPLLADAGRAGAAGQIAYHWEVAGQPERSLEASMVAGRAADALCAPAEAAAHYRRALSLWDLTDAPASLARADHAEVLMAAADALQFTGDLEQAICLSSVALAEVDVGGDAVRRAFTRERLARLTWCAGEPERSLALYEEAVGLVADCPPSPGTARIIAAHAQGLMLEDRYHEAILRSDEAIRQARAVGDRPTEVQASITLGTAWAWVGRVQQGVAQLLSALAIARDLGDADGLFRAVHNLGWPLAELGRPEESIELLHEGIAVAARLGRSAKVVVLQTQLVEALTWTARLDEATTVLGDISEPDPGLSRERLLRAAAGLALSRGDVAAADIAVDAALAKIQTSALTDAPDVLVLAALVAVVSGRIDTARTHIDDARGRLARSETPGRRIEAAVLGVLIEGEAARHEHPHRHEDAERRIAVLLEEARGAAARPLDDLATVSVRERALLALMEAEARSAIGTADPVSWASAVTALDDTGMTLVAAHARLRHAEAILATRGRRCDAARATGECRDSAETAGARWLVDQADRLAGRARLDLDQARPQPTLPAPAAEFGLTPREFEVLAHLADGRTNGEIGVSLFISQKTASVHVSNLMRKLGVSHRIEAGAIGQRLHLRQPH